MKLLRSLSMRRQVYCVIAVCAVTILATVLFASLALIENNRASRREEITRIESNIRADIGTRVLTVKNFALYTAYTDLFREYMLNATPYIDHYLRYKYICSNLDSLLESHDFICSASYVSANGSFEINRNRTSSFSSQVYAANYPLLSKPQRYIGENQTNCYTDRLELSATNKNYAAYIEKVNYHNGIAKYTSESPTLYMLLVCDMDTLSDCLASYNTSESDVFALTDGSGVVLASNRATLIGKPLPTDMYEQRDVSVHTYLLPGCSWTLTTSMDMRYTTVYPREFLRFSLILTCLLLALLAAFAVIFEKSAVRPISDVIAQLGQIPASIDSVRIECSMQNEIGMLVRCINDMLCQIETSNKAILRAQEELYASELSRTKVRLAALQNQINPHFLYNTLECLRSIGSAYGVPEVSRIAFSMGRIFHYCIKGADIVTVRDEIGIIQEYISIIDIRFLGKHTASISVDDEILALPVIKMTLQPIVENAVYHGLETKGQPGHLSVRGTRDEAYLHFSIMDDGIGIESGKLHELQESLHMDETDSFNTSKRAVGLRNIYMRCALYYGEAFRFEIDSTPNIGTTVRIDIPLMRDNGAAGSEAEKTK